MFISSNMLCLILCKKKVPVNSFERKLERKIRKMKEKHRHTGSPCLTIVPFKIHLKLQWRWKSNFTTGPWTYNFDNVPVVTCLKFGCFTTGRYCHSMPLSIANCVLHISFQKAESLEKPAGKITSCDCVIFHLAT